jgi:predicted membrane protein
VLDLREAMLQSQRITILATVMGGTLQLIVPEGIAVEVTGTAMLSRKNPASSAGGLSRKNNQAVEKPAAGAAPQGMPVIEVRALTLGGRVKVVRPRRSRWRGPLSRRRS